MILEYYVNRADRDAAAKRYRAQGIKVRVSAPRNFVLTPDAVTGYTGYRSPNGFGGSADKWWSVLYCIEGEY